MMPPKERATMPYRPAGERGYSATKQRGKIPPGVMVLLNTWPVSVRYAYVEQDDPSKQDGLLLTISGNSNRQQVITFSLADFTKEELDEFRRVINLALDKAEPTVVARDKAATDAWEIDHDDTDYRNYRAAPNLVVRDRALAEYPASCAERSQYVPRAMRDDIGAAPGDGDGSPEVAQGSAEDEVGGDGT